MGPRRKRQRLSENGAAASVVDTERDDATLSHDKSEDPIYEQQRDPRTLFVRLLPKITTTEDLNKHFSESFPIKHSVAVLDKTTKQCKGYGFVTFVDEEDAREACAKFDNSELNGRKIKVELAEARQREIEPGMEHLARKTSHKREVEPPPKLIVRNLPWSIKEPEQLTKLFQSFGKVKNVIIPKNPQGVMMGFAIVLLRGRKNSEKALAAINGREIDGRTLAVDWAVDKNTWERSKADDVQNNNQDGAQDISEGQAHLEKGPKRNGTVENSEQLETAAQADDEVDHDSISEDPEIDEASAVNSSMDVESEESADENASNIKTFDTNKTSVFIRNLPFNCADEDLEDFFSKFGEVRFARVVYDSVTERSKGSGFVCFKILADMITCIKSAPKSPASQQVEAKTKSNSKAPSILQDESTDLTGDYTMDGRVLLVSRAVDKAEASRLKEEKRVKRDTDKRRLYLLSEGHIHPKSPLYKKLSPSEIAMREASEKQRKALVKKTPTLKLSLTRLSVRNIPRWVTSKDLKALAREAVVEFATEVKEGKRQKLKKEELDRAQEEMREAETLRKQKGKGIVKQAKIVFENRQGSKVPEAEGAGRSRGYGFIEYWTHRSALMGLRWLNGHLMVQLAEDQGKRSKGSDVPDKKRRLIVEFALENAQVIHRRKEREQKARSRSKKGPEELEADGQAGLNGIRIELTRSTGKNQRGNSRKQRDLPPLNRQSGGSQGQGSTGPEDSQKKEHIIARKRMARRVRKRASR